MKQVSLDALNAHLFETIEMLKNNNDPEASENEKIDIETAKQIANISKVIVDAYRIKAQVIETVLCHGNADQTKKILSDSGISD